MITIFCKNVLILNFSIYLLHHSLHSKYRSVELFFSLAPNILKTYRIMPEQFRNQFAVSGTYLNCHYL